MVIYQRILIAVLLFGGGYISLQGMDNPQPSASLKPVGTPGIFKLTDQRINETRFYQAVCRGDIRVVRKMVKDGFIDPHESLECYFWTKNTDIPSIATLVTERHNIKKCEFHDNCHAQEFLPLVLAVAQNQHEIVRFFVEKCAIDIDTHSEEIPTALHIAVTAYNVDLVRYLLGRSAHPLYHSASAERPPQTVLDFIAGKLSQSTAMAPADIEKLKQIQHMVIEAIATNHYPVLTAYWRQKTYKQPLYLCIDLTEQQVDQTRFYQALCEGDLPLIKTMIAQGKIDPNKTLECHYHFAPGKTVSVHGWFAITNRHTLKNPEQEYFSHAPFLALNEAIAQKQQEIITFLVGECHVNVNAHYAKHSTSLHTALYYGDPDLITYLIRYGANPLYKNAFETPCTVLEQINEDIASPIELGPEKIARLQKIRPIIAKALNTRNYPDPYAHPDSSSSSDSDEGTDDDDNGKAVVEPSDVTDGDRDEGDADDVVLLPSSSSSSTSGASVLPNSSSADPNNNGNAIHHPNGPNLPPVVPNQQAPRVGNAQHGPGRPVVSTKYSWKIPAISVVGIVCGIIGIKKLYTWYMNGDEEDGQEADQTTVQKESGAIASSSL